MHWLIAAGLASWLHALVGILAMSSLDTASAGPESASICILPAMTALGSWWAGWWYISSSRGDVPFHRRWRRISVRVLCGVHVFGTMVMVLYALRPGAVSPIMDSLLRGLWVLTLTSAPFVWATAFVGMPLLRDLAQLGQAPGSIPAHLFGGAARGVGFTMALAFAGSILLPPLGYFFAVLTIGGFVGLSIAWPLMLAGLQDPIRDVLRTRGVLR